MDRQGGLTVRQAAAQLGVSDKTLYRRLRQPGHAGLDAWKVHTDKGEEWRVNLTTTLDTSQDSAGQAMSTVPLRMDGPSVSQVGTVEASLLVGLVAEMARERDELARRLGAAEAEREQLRHEVESLRTQQTQAYKPLQRAWAWFRQGRGDGQA